MRKAKPTAGGGIVIIRKSEFIYNRGADPSRSKMQVERVIKIGNGSHHLFQFGTFDRREGAM